MKYSFIVPVYNCEEYIASTVLNILNIYQPDFEVLLIDDGSKDRSGELCDQLATENEKIRCIHQKNQGVSSARNNGLKLATGDYVIFVDADDFVDTKELDKILSQINDENAPDMVIFGLAFDYYHKHKLYRSDKLSPALTETHDSRVWPKALYELYSTNSLSPIWNKIIRRQVLVDNHLELRADMFLYEDLEFSLRCMAECDKILFIPNIVYHYRQSEDEGNAGRRLKRVQHIPVVIEQIETALNQLRAAKEATRQLDINHMLLTLYLVLAREKISASSVNEIREVCNDFSNWWTLHGKMLPANNQELFTCLIHKKVMKLMMRRTYTRMRHWLAIRVKNSAFYQKRMNKRAEV